MGLGFCDFHVWYFVSPIFLSSTTYEPRGVGTVVDFLSPYLYLHKEVKLPTYSQWGNLRILMSLNILREITIVKLVTSYVNWVVIMPISKCFDKFMLWKFTAFKTVTVVVFKTLEICPNWFHVKSEIGAVKFLNFHTVILTAELWSLRAKIKELQHSPP